MRRWRFFVPSPAEQRLRRIRELASEALIDRAGVMGPVSRRVLEAIVNESKGER